MFPSVDGHFGIAIAALSFDALRIGRWLETVQRVLDVISEACEQPVPRALAVETQRFNDKVRKFQMHRVATLKVPDGIQIVPEMETHFHRVHVRFIIRFGLDSVMVDDAVMDHCPQRLLHQFLLHLTAAPLRIATFRSQQLTQCLTVMK